MRTLSTTRCHRRCGFTIIELVVVTTLIALLAGVGLRTSVKRYRKVQVEKGAREIFLAAKFARIFAVEKQRPCKLLLGVEEGSYCISGRLEKGGEVTVFSNPYTKPGTLHDGVTFEKLSITPSREQVSSEDSEESNESIVVFRADGTADGASVQIGDGTYHYSVNISASNGKATVEVGELGEETMDVIDLDEVQ